ncbi:MAG: GNAT family N-acetyltransferase [Deltaproteobacteria bacterium]|nr:GNAT family N-acetyltransferase [Deltaproteobacteria bacterium]
MDFSTVKRIQCLDKEGSEFGIGLFDEGDMSSVLHMYEVFTPRPASQGLPPEKSETCRKWVIDLMGMSENVLAWRDGAVIGHASVNPDYERKDCEFVIFVHQDCRSKGVGNELTKLMIKRAKRIGIDSVWLTVDTRNYKAIRLYQKHGFNFIERDSTECSMKLMLIPESGKVQTTKLSEQPALLSKSDFQSVKDII